MDHKEDGDSIEEIGLDRKTIFGNRTNPCSVDLVKGVIINIRSSENLKTSQNIRISMLEKLLNQMDADEKTYIDRRMRDDNDCL